MEERFRFVAPLLDGEGMSDVCREFGGDKHGLFRSTLPIVAGT
jgi:hypothetical protein